MVWLVHIWARVSCMACVYCMACVARQTSFFLFPILIIPVLGMESPRRDPWPPHPTKHHPGRSWRHTWRVFLPSPDIAPRCHPDIPRIAFYASSYHIQTSPIYAGPDTEQDSTAPQRYGPYHVIYALSRPAEKKGKKIAKCHIHYTPNYPILPYLSASFTLALTLHIDTN